MGLLFNYNNINKTLKLKNCDVRVSLAFRRVLTIMCFLRSPELDSPKRYTKRRALRILSILR